MTQARPVPITLERLIHNRAIAAQIVKLHGEWAMPVFERLDRDIQTRQKQEQRLAAALSAANIPPAD